MFRRLIYQWRWWWNWYRVHRRVKPVLRRYVKALLDHRTNASIRRPMFCGISALRNAGAASLEKHELRNLCYQIEDLGYTHPNWMPEILPNERLLDFLKWVKANKVDISNGPYLAWEIAIFKRQILPQVINFSGRDSPEIPNHFS